MILSSRSGGRKNSVCVINNIPSPYRRVLFDEIARMAAADNWSFSVIYLSEKESVRDWQVELRPFETVLQVRRQKRNPVTPTSDVILNRRYLARVVRPKIAILFGYNYRTYLVTALLRRLLRRPTYLFCETTLNDSSASLKKKVAKALMLRFCFDRFIVPGQRSASYLAAHGVAKDRVFFARNASPLHPARQPLIDPADRLHLLFVGRFAPEKCILEFVCAFVQIDTQAKLTLVGSGPLSEELAELAANDDRIDMLGSVAPEHLSEIYARHNVLVLVSEREPWGFVVNEAINHGLALILSPEVGCLPDLLRGNGIRLDAITPIDIAAMLENIQASLTTFRARSLKIAEETTVEHQANAFVAAVTGASNAAS